MRNQIILLLFAFQLSFSGCSGSTEAYRAPVKDVAFASADEAWVITQKKDVTQKDELIRLSADGTLENATEFPSKIESVSFVGPSKGWVIDSAGKIWRLDGQHWSIAGVNDKYGGGALSVNFIDENIGWIRFLEPLFLTEDGGKTWDKVTTTGPGELTRLFAADRDTAYLYGPEGRILRTGDRGRTWEPRDLGVGSDVTAFDCRDGHPDDCWAGTARGEIFVISDKGTHKQLRLPEQPREIAVLSICLTGENGALIAGYPYMKAFGDTTYGFLYATYDNGQSWESIDVPRDDRFVNVSAFGDTIWLASHAAIYRSADSGKNWTKLLALDDTPPVEPSDETTATPTSVLSRMPLVVQAWEQFIADGRYRLAKAGDFDFPEAAWKSLGSYDLNNFVHTPFSHSIDNSRDGFVAVVVDTTRNDTERFGLVIFTNPEEENKQNVPEPFWLYKNKDLSRTQITGDSEGVALRNYREDGSDSFCYIKWNPKKQRYFCLDLSGKAQ